MLDEKKNTQNKKVKKFTQNTTLLCLYERPEVIKLIETDSQMMVASARVRRLVNNYTVDTEFWFCMKKKF